MIDKQRVANVLSIGSLILFATLTILIILSILIGNEINDNRLVASLAATGISVIAMIAAKNRRTLIASGLLVIMTFGAGVTSLALWSINTPIGLLLVILSIILSAVMIGVRVSVIVSIISAVTIFLILILNHLNLLHSDFKSLAVEPTLGDAIGYAVILIIISVVSWLAGSNIEKSYSLLKSTKDNIEKQLSIERRKIRESNKREIDQLFNFAQLGQHSSLVLHDLANQLAVLNFTDNHATKDNISEAQATIADVEKLVSRAYQQLSDMTKAVLKLQEIVKIVNSRYSTESTIHNRLTKASAQSEHIIVNPDQFLMVTDVLFKNAVEALSKSNRRNKSITIDMWSEKKSFHISISDNSGTLNKGQAKLLFETGKTTKTHGHGIGLVVAKHIVNYHLSGDLTCNVVKQNAIFTISIPLESN